MFTHGGSERTRVSGFVLFKEWGVFILLPMMFGATMLAVIALRGSPFQIQIASIVAYTGVVFFFVFCDAGPGRAIKTKGTKGFSLGRRRLGKSCRCWCASTRDLLQSSLLA